MALKIQAALLVVLMDGDGPESYKAYKKYSSSLEVS